MIREHDQTAVRVLIGELNAASSQRTGLEVPNIRGWK